MAHAARDQHMRGFELGHPRTDLRLRLVDAVLRGVKTATTSLREEYEPHTTEPMPVAGGSYALLGYAQEPVGVVLVTEVSSTLLGAVELQFACDEGEDFASLAEWKTAHLSFWAPRRVDDSTSVVCERFRLVGVWR